MTSTLNKKPKPSSRLTIRGIRNYLNVIETRSERCPECGRKVLLPCLACEIELSKRRRTGRV